MISITNGINQCRNCNTLIHHHWPSLTIHNLLSSVVAFESWLIDQTMNYNEYSWLSEILSTYHLIMRYLNIWIMIPWPAINWFEYIAIKSKLFKQTWWYFHCILLSIIDDHHHHWLTTTLVPETWTNGLSVNKSWRAWPNSWKMVWIYHSLIIIIKISYCIVQNNRLIIWSSKWQMRDNHSLFFIHSSSSSSIHSLTMGCWTWPWISSQRLQIVYIALETRLEGRAYKSRYKSPK